MCNSAKHNARPGRSSKWIRRTTRIAIYMRDEWLCAVCGIGPAECLDHIVPKSRGGTNHPTNLVTACHRCNNSRQDKPAPAHVHELAQRPLNRARARLVVRAMDYLRPW